MHKVAVLGTLGAVGALAAGCVGSHPGAVERSQSPHHGQAALLPGAGSHAATAAAGDPAPQPATPASTPGTVATASAAAAVHGAGQPASHGPLTSPPLPAPGPGFLAGRVTAIGDSVMIDYATALAADIPGVSVTASVGRQWGEGEAVLGQLEAQGGLGAVVIVGLGTNGPISATDVTAMMALLAGASRVVFVNVHVDRTWQASNDATLAVAVARYPRAVLVDWDAVAARHPEWLYATGTHMPIDGPGAEALAALVADAA